MQLFGRVGLVAAISGDRPGSSSLEPAVELKPRTAPRDRVVEVGHEWADRVELIDQSGLNLEHGLLHGQRLPPG